jgi:hypothetical protein
MKIIFSSFLEYIFEGVVVDNPFHTIRNIWALLLKTHDVYYTGTNFPGSVKGGYQG